MQVNAVQVKNGKVEDVLNKLLKNKGVSYVIKDGIIYLKKKEITTTPSTQQPRQKRTYKGTLLDENKEPLIGATILVKGTNHRAVTDMDGNLPSRPMNLPLSCSLHISDIRRWIWLQRKDIT